MRAIRTPSEDNLRRDFMERQSQHAQYQMNQHAVDQRTHNLLQAVQGVNPFHSPYVDPVGSIIGLRVLYIDGNMCYVPVEPQLNFMINQQFGRMSVEPEERLNNGRSIIQQLQNRQPEVGRPNYEERRGANQEAKATTAASSSGVSSLSGEPAEMDDPPWSRPHPQPANGKRGTAAWRNENMPRKSSMNRQPPGGFTSDLFGTGLSSSASTNHSHQSRRSQPAHHTYEPPPAQENRLGNQARERRNQYQQPEEEYNPWGRGGGGAPLRDGQGNVVADRRKLGAFWSRSVDTNEVPHMEKESHFLPPVRPAYAYDEPFRRPSLDYLQNNQHQPYFYLPSLYPSSHYNEYHPPPVDEYSNRRGGGSSMAHATSMPSLASKQTTNFSPEDHHRSELEKQIADNKRRKEEERLKEIEMEKKEIQRWEERNARIRAEEEEAKNKAREKAIAMERRKEAIAARQEQAVVRGRRTPPPQMQHIERRDEEYNGGERKLEWWEKKPTWQDQQIEREASAILPALRNKGSRTPSAPSRVTSAAGDRNDSRQSYRPADSVRQNSARRSQTPVQARRAPVKKAEAFSIMG